MTWYNSAEHYQKHVDQYQQKLKYTCFLSSSHPVNQYKVGTSDRTFLDWMGMTENILSCTMSNQRPWFFPEFGILFNCRFLQSRASILWSRIDKAWEKGGRVKDIPWELYPAQQRVLRYQRCVLRLLAHLHNSLGTKGPASLLPKTASQIL